MPYDSQVTLDHAVTPGLCLGEFGSSAFVNWKPANRVHVLFLIDELCSKGGAESALLNTVRWLPADRFCCSVITFRIDLSLPMLAEFPCPVEVLPLRRTYDFNALCMGVRLAKFIRERKVDIVHTFFASADLWGGAIAKLSRRPVISGRRDMGFQRSLKHRVAYRALHGMFDRVLAVSELVRKYSIEQDGLDPAKVITIYNAVDAKASPAETKAEIRSLLGLEDASHVITTVGNIRYIKGLDLLIRAAAVVCREFPGARFVIAGGAVSAEPGYLGELQKLCQMLDVAGKVKFLGPIGDVTPLLEASDVFCLLSRSEGFSNALLEAMARGLPCVATRVGGNGEALEDGHTGYLVDSDDSDMAVERLLSLLRNPIRARQMGAYGRQTVASRFTPGIVTEQLVQVYDTLLRRS